MTKTYKLHINRWDGEKTMSRETWKELISALALAGYEVYADEEWIKIKIGYDDKVFEED